MKINSVAEVFQNHSLEIQKKVKVLWALNLVLTVMMILVTVGMVAGQNWIGLVVSPTLALVFVVSNIFLKRGRYLVASNIHIIVLTVLLTTTSLLSPMYIKQLWYIFSVVMLLFLDVAVIADRIYQIRFVNILGFLSVVTTALLIMSNPDETSPVVINDVITVMLIFFISVYFSNTIFRLYKDVIDLAQGESQENKAQLEKVSRVLKSLKSNMRVGETLRESTSQTLDSINRIDGELQDYQEKVMSLGSQMEEYGKLSGDVVRVTDAAAQGVVSQSALVAETTAAVEEMTASIKNVTTVSEAKRESIRGLVDTAEQGSQAMTSAVQAIARIENTSNDILNVIKIINNIVAQTSLLSMNAAIEAAHAGDSGRGFAVVAEEIRKLAGNSASNTKIVTETLKTNIESVSEAARLNSQAQDFFRKIDRDIQEISGAIEEIINSMTEISQGTSEVSEAVVSLREISLDTQDLVEKVKAFMDTSQNQVESIQTHSKDSSVKIEEIAGHFKGILQETQKIEDIGKKNIELMAQIDRDLAGE